VPSVEPDVPLGQLIEDAIGSAIENVVADHEGGFVTKWVALVESVDRDGARGLWTMTSPEVMAWDTVGLLTHGLHLQQLATLQTNFEPE
jgi:hypothetical protein